MDLESSAIAWAFEALFLIIIIAALTLVAPIMLIATIT
jgi:hypothetical protein